ncbi:MAG: DUF4367 domain-containing protein [Clostridia bacterium]|nr:DUF4367 domain-containing protein [Clostridia bacterium]
MKKLFVIALALVTAVCVTACGKTPEPVTEPLTETESEQGYAGMANPWQDCDTLEDAAKIAGFEMAVPDRIEGYPYIVIQAAENSMSQVYYVNEQFDPDKSKTVLIRKGTGSEDISGDYNEYGENEVVTMHGVDVTVRGDNGLVYNAFWFQDGYAYCINAEAGMSREQIENLVEVVK